jgi:hypothetical protein
MLKSICIRYLRNCSLFEEDFWKRSFSALLIHFISDFILVEVFYVLYFTWEQKSVFNSTGRIETEGIPKAISRKQHFFNEERCSRRMEEICIMRSFTIFTLH